LGLIDKVPAVTGVQAEGCAPVAEAFARGGPVREWTAAADTVASGINDPLLGYARFGDHILDGIRMTGGGMAAVPDSEILAAMRAMGRLEGLFAEPASACPVAAAKRAAEKGELGPGASAVCVMSSCGFKELETAAKCAGAEPPPVVRSASELDQLIKGVSL
jgi:threonine synthase